MSRRSVMNDRYRVEQKGKTRKSASAAKPKRAAGEATVAAKKPAAKPKSALGRLFGGGGSSTPAARIEPTPQMKMLRRWWWVCMGAAILLALVMIQTSKMGNPTVDRAVLGAYAVALGGALYLEFGPLRRARIAAAAAAKGGKGAAKQAKVAAGPPAERSAAAGVLGRLFGKTKSSGGADGEDAE